MKFLPPKIEFPVRNVDELKHVLERMYNDVYLEVLRHETIAWVEVTSFENSWVNYGGTNQTAGYVKDAFGFVHLKGVVKNGSSIPTIIFTLPAGYRPTAAETFTTHSHGFGACTVTADGEVVAAVGSVADFWLSGITFYAG